MLSGSVPPTAGEAQRLGQRPLTASEGATAWREQGWALMDMSGLPEEGGLAVRDFDSAPAPAWLAPLVRRVEGSGSGGGDAAANGSTDGEALGSLSGADRAFWEASAYTTDELSMMTEWIMSDAAIDADGTADASGGGPAAGVVADGDGRAAALAAEVATAVAAFRGTRLQCDPNFGLGLAPFLQQHEAIAVATSAPPSSADGFDGASSAPQPADWQDSPSKVEWKALARLYAQRREAGEGPSSLRVLAEALRASGSRAAWRVVEEAARKAAA